jgi:predicted ATPase
MLQQDPKLEREPSAEATVSALPAPPNRLVGRERELAELRDLLRRRDARLVVLTGAGGSGKTRLAVEAARLAASSFANGAVLVDLSGVRSSEFVLGTIARAVGAELPAGEDPLPALAAALQAREQLLVLDNVEHLRAATSQFVYLLARAPHLVLLITSRVVLHLSGEHVYPVEPLAAPDAAALFHQRAREADARFHASPEDTRAIEAICDRLDRLPLAIELAATRIGALAPADLLDRIDSRLPLLTVGRRDLPDRQRTLEAALQWSFELLDPEGRRDLAQLSIFAGGFTLEAAETVCGTTVDRVSALVDHSLLRRDHSASGSRYTMLEVIGEFARGQLNRRDVDHLARRHAEYFLSVGEDTDARLGEERERAQRKLAPELDNLRVAIQWAIDADAAAALRLGWVAFLFQPTTNELRLWLDKILALPSDGQPLARAKALHAAAHLAGSSQELARARDLWGQALALYRDAGHDAGVARALAGLATVAARAGGFEGARALYAKSLDLYRTLGDSDGEWIAWGAHIRSSCKSSGSCAPLSLCTPRGLVASSTKTKSRPRHDD